MYRASQSRLDRVVALKVIDPRAHTDGGSLRRFERESKAIGALTGHPSVVTVFDTGTTADGDPYLVMEFLPGGSLQERARNDGPIPWPEVVSVGLAVAEALAAAHEIGILHRDVKPGNVLSDRYGRYKLSDFGIAGLAAQETTTGAATAMTVAYAAPEVLLGQRATETSDLYSLGALLYALLAGVPAYSGDTDESIVPMILRITTAPLVPLTEALGPAPLRTLIEGLMAKEPAARPPSALDVVGRLQQLSASTGEPPTAGSPTDDQAAAIGPDQNRDMVTPPPPDAEDDVADTVFRARANTEDDATETVFRTPPTGRTDTSPTSPDPTSVRATASRARPGADPVPAPPSDGASGERAGSTGRQRARWVVAAAVVVLVGGGAAWAAAADDDNDNETTALAACAAGTEATAGGACTAATTEPAVKVKVPSVIGATPAAARAILERLGLEVVVNPPRPDEKQPKGRIANQDPAAGATLARGAVIHIVESVGPAPRAVLDYVGRDVFEAQQGLEAKGFTVSLVSETSGSALGTVLSIDPEPGTMLAKGSAVVLHVSKGQPTTTVPDRTTTPAPYDPYYPTDTVPYPAP
ncbi:MAG: hypothetical protein JWM47_3627 [Acidimicrobiales bacterium]|nr:hypothetical protein [Acidimicrobiales bacterium]